jgi:hypothetical protein
MFRKLTIFTILSLSLFVAGAPLDAATSVRVADATPTGTLNNVSVERPSDPLPGATAPTRVGAVVTRRDLPMNLGTVKNTVGGIAGATVDQVCCYHLSLSHICSRCHLICIGRRNNH